MGLPCAPEQVSLEGKNSLDGWPIALIAFVDADQRYRFNNYGYEDWFGQSSTVVAGLYSHVNAVGHQLRVDQASSWALLFADR